MFLTADEVISGREGEIWINIDGQLRLAAEIRKIEAKTEKTKSTFLVIGHRGEQNKTTGFKCTGTMTMYYGVSVWASVVEDYMKTGKDLFFPIVVTNEDPSTIRGAQRVRLNRCNLNDITVVSLDADSEFLTQEVSFTFDDYDILDKFNAPV